MAAIPPNIARVPNLLTSQVSLAGINRSSVGLLKVQEQLASGKSINRISDDAVRAAVALAIESRVRQTDQRLRNFDHASSLLDTTDQALGEASDITREAHGIGLSQIGVGSDASTRAAQAVVVGSLIDALVRVGNRDLTGIHVFGGGATSASPFVEFLGGYRYVGQGEGIRNDLGEGLDVPITVGAQQAFGALSSRVRGDVDVNPALTRQTSLTDIRGGRNRGVSLGQIQVTITNGPPQTIAVDLSGAKNVGDVLDRLESSIAAADPAVLTPPFPAGAGTVGERLAFNVALGSITFADIGAGSIAADLGISGFTFDNLNPTNPAGDLDPALTDLTAFSSFFGGVGVPAGSFRIRNGAAQGTVTVSPTTTITEFKQAVAALSLGVRAEISADGRSIDVLNEVSGIRMSIEEIAGGTTATTLGIRTFKSSTPLSVFNDGRGVEIAHGAVDPITGLPDPLRNMDFRVTLKDGTTFDVDLDPADTTVADVVAKMQAAADLAVPPPGTVVIGLVPDGNGITITDPTIGAGQTAVSSLYGHAAEDLGLLDATFTAGVPATLAGTDRARVRVDGALTSLIELREALATNDQRGISLAAERLDDDGDLFIQARALVGARSQRVETARQREEDVSLVNQTILGQLTGLDYTEASSRYSLLELSRQAGLASTARLTSLSLLDFLPL